MHTCDRETCGWSCWPDNGVNVREQSLNYGDAGDVDAEVVCECEAHE